MAIATYGDLKTAIASRLARTDLTADIPNFIDDALQRVNLELQSAGGIAAQEVEATSSTTADQESYQLPSDFQMLRYIKIDTDPLEQMTYSQMLEEYGDTTGTPEKYDLLISDIYLRPIPSGVSTLTIGYTSTFTTLSNDSDTNWLITSGGNVLLYGALMHASMHLRDDARVPGFTQAFKEAMRIILRGDRRARMGNKPNGLVVDAFLRAPVRSSILNG